MPLRCAALVFALTWLAPLAARAEPVAVIAHRGARLHCPENTLPSLQAAIDMGADYAELDVRTSRDGALVLMHDAKVDRTTTGTGEVSNMTLAELRALDAGARFGAQWAGTMVPTFDAALALARGHIGIYVDAKDVQAETLVAALVRNGMTERVVVYGGLPLLAAVARLRPEVRVMPEAGNREALREALASLALRVVAFDARDFTPELIDSARRAHLQRFVDRLGTSDNPSAWEAAIRDGATGIQTDHPQELIDFLRAHP